MHKKANPWRILVLVVKWRHHENGILTREKGRLFTNASLKRLVRSYGLDIQLFQKTLSGEKQKVFKPRPQGNVGCFKSVFCWQTITPLNWSLIFIRHLHWTILIILVFKICFKSFPTFRSPLTYRKTFHTVPYLRGLSVLAERLFAFLLTTFFETTVHTLYKTMYT